MIGRVSPVCRHESRVGERLADQGFVHIADVPAEETWAQLQADPKAVLIDVRTKAEWAFVGLPDLSALGRRVITERVAAALTAAGAGTDDKLFFICRSGGRSRMAAEAMAEAGFRHCTNVAEGFEGPLDAGRHRGGVAGWKAAGLPWVQG
jgi:rhodanese-related sulfurtransferase